MGGEERGLGRERKRGGDVEEGKKRRDERDERYQAVRRKGEGTGREGRVLGKKKEGREEVREEDRCLEEVERGGGWRKRTGN